MLKKGLGVAVVRAVMGKGCSNCGKLKENHRSSYCDDCREDFVREKVRDEDAIGSGKGSNYR